MSQHSAQMTDDVPAAPPSVLALLAVAHMAWLEARRSHLVALSLWTALAGSLLALSTAEAAQLHQGRLLIDMGLMIASLLGTATAISHTLSHFGGDADTQRFSVLLAHPVSRWTLLVGRLVGLWGVLIVMVAIMAAATWCLLYLCGHRPAAIFYEAWAMVPMELLVVLCLTQLCATLGSKAVASLMTAGLWIAGNLADDFFQLIHSSRSTVTERRVFATLFALIPDFTQLTLRQEAANGLEVPLAYLGRMLVYGVSVSAIMATLACLIFSRRKSL